MGRTLKPRSVTLQIRDVGQVADVVGCGDGQGIGQRILKRGLFRQNDALPKRGIIRIRLPHIFFLQLHEIVSLLPNNHTGVKIIQCVANVHHNCGGASHHRVKHFLIPIIFNHRTFHAGQVMVGRGGGTICDKFATEHASACGIRPFSFCQS